MSYARVIDEAARTLEAAGFSRADGQRDAAVLARDLLGWTMADWLTRSREVAPAVFHGPFEAAIRRRAAHEPVAYITGTREFYGRAFRVTRDVLIPRPETELLVDQAIACLAGEWALGRESPVVLDIGTGSGCVAISLALEYSSARVTATDISAAALAIAVENADRLGAANRIAFLRRSLADGLSGIDLIVSNPPYVAARDVATLMPDVRDYEPATALFGGPDGLDVIRQLMPDVARALAPQGWLALEVGVGQADVVRALGESAGLTWHQTAADLAGIPRVVVMRK